MGVGGRRPQAGRDGHDVGEFVVDRVLGRTMASDLYLASHPRFGPDLVVVKVLRATADEQERRLFVTGNELALRYRHPNLVAVLGVGRLDELRPWAAVPFHPRGSLADAGSQPVEAVLHLGARLADVLALLHAVDVVHRDVKPGNVLLADDGEPVLTDLNVAGRLGDDTGSVTTTLLTRSYSAPEVTESARFDVRSEIFSLGATLADLADEVPEPLGALLARMRAAEPDLRPGSCVEVADALRAIQRSMDLPVTSTTPPLHGETASPRRSASGRRRLPRRRALTVGALLLAGIVVGALVADAYRSSSGDDRSSFVPPSALEQPFLSEDFDGARLDPTTWLAPTQPAQLYPADRVLNMIGTTAQTDAVDTDLVPRAPTTFRELDFHVAVPESQSPGAGGGAVVVTERGGRTHRFLWGPSPGEATPVMAVLICRRPTCATYDDYVPPPVTRDVERIAPGEQVPVKIVHTDGRLRFLVRDVVIAAAEVAGPLDSFRFNAYAEAGERWRLTVDAVRVYR